MNTHRDRVLLLCYGNPGRQDDGLGPALAGELRALALPGVTVEEALQLQIEHAVLLAEHDRVVFVDADAAGPEPFELRTVEPRPAVSFSSHYVAPAALLALAREHFEADAVGLVLGIRGYRFDGFGERLSTRAQSNLTAAVRFLTRALGDASLFETTAAVGRSGR